MKIEADIKKRILEQTQKHVAEKLALEEEKLALFEEEQRRREADEMERKEYLQRRSDILIKCFSEKVSPFHVEAARKAGFAEWKEQFSRSVREHGEMKLEM
jgi:hypothetical protein